MNKRLLWSCLVPVLVVASVLVDAYLQIPVVSLATMALSVVVAINNWKSGARVVAIALFLVGGAGWAYAINAAVQFVGDEAAEGKSIANAARCYQQSTGQVPQRLEDLVPQFLPELPRIRSPLAGRPRYKLVGANDWCVVWTTGGECYSTYPKKTCASGTSSGIVPRKGG
jgi:hypothetical protein